MTTKTEALYNTLLPLRVVTFNEIVEKASDLITTQSRRYIYRKYVDRLVKEGKLRRVRKSLYHVLSPLEQPEKSVVDKILIASKVRKEYYLGFHTALEFYGCANSLHNEAYVAVIPKNRFNPFHYSHLTFKPVFVEDVTYEVEEKQYQDYTVKVSSKERTFIDCIDRVQYAGGWEECIKSLQNLGGLNPEKLLNLLEWCGKDAVYRRVGYTLELLRKQSQFYEQIDDFILGRIEQKVTGPPRYLTHKGKTTLNKKWKLYIPDDFEEKLRGI